MIRPTPQFAAVALMLGTGALLSAGPSSAASLQPHAVHPCSPSNVTVRLGAWQGTAGTFYVPVIFTVKAGTCTLYGVPAIQPLGGTNHHPVGPVAQNASIGQMPVLHTVSAGHSVSASIGFGDTGNYPAARCHAAGVNGIAVTLPSLGATKYVALSSSVCTALSSVSTRLIVAGTGG